MDIKMKNTAYYFPSASALKAFIKIHGEKLMRRNDMAKRYKEYEDITFRFFKCTDGIDWFFDYKRTYQSWGYKIIEWGQRGE